jgi:hypothetical protein
LRDGKLYRKNDSGKFERWYPEFQKNIDLVKEAKEEKLDK